MPEKKNYDPLTPRQLREIERAPRYAKQRVEFGFTREVPVYPEHRRAQIAKNRMARDFVMKYCSAMDRRGVSAEDRDVTRFVIGMLQDTVMIPAKMRGGPESRGRG